MTHEFRLVATSGEIALVNEYIPKLLEKNYVISNPKEMYTNHIIEIDGIGDLLELIDATKYEVVIVPPIPPHDKYPFIEIYDDWRE